MNVSNPFFATARSLDLGQHQVLRIGRPILRTAGDVARTGADLASEPEEGGS
jgi:hypothetical protein